MNLHFQWSSVLAQDEQIQKEFGISSRYLMAVLIGSVLGGLVVVFVVWFMGIFLFLLGLLYWYYMKKSKHYAFTSKRVVLVDAFFGMAVTSIDYNQITDIEITQSAIDQIGGWGTLTINSAGTHVPETYIQFIDNVQEVKKSLDEIRGHS
jgi:uncharacterized membrane protein YdbT with pleckstrin-like domain